MIADKWARRVALGSCWLAFWLAICTLDLRGLWGDEAFSVWASKQPALALIAGLDAQPPLYHLLLGAGRLLWGESVFAVRYSSVVCAVLLVAVGARLGQRIAGLGVASLTALLLSTSPILLYYAQEARMYALAALLAGGAMLSAQTMRHPGRGSSSAAQWGAYGALSLGALFAHYYAAGVLFVNALALAGAALRSRDARRIRAWLAGHAAIALIFGGWSIGLQSRYVARSAAGRGRIVPLFEDIVTNFGVGVNGLLFGMRADGSSTVVALALFALALAGLVGYWRRSQRRDALLILGWVVASLGVVSATAARSGIVSDFSPRYYLFALLPLTLAVGGWLCALSPKRPAAPGLSSPGASPRTFALVALLALAPAVVGNVQLLDAGWQKSRYEAMIAVIRERAQPGDGVVLVNSDQFPLLEYYGPLDVPAWIVSNDALNRDPDLVGDELARFAADKTRAWLVNYGWAMALQPRSVVEQALNARGVRTYAQGFQDVALALYDLRLTAGDAPVQPRDVRFGGQIALIGLRERAQVYRPGEAVTLDLIWRAERKPQADYTVFMHLRRADDGGQVAALDSPPQNGAAPTSGWSPGQVISEARAVPIPADAPAGDYHVIIGWYRYPSFERLTIDDQGTTEYLAARVRVVE